MIHQKKISLAMMRGQCHTLSVWNSVKSPSQRLFSYGIWCDSIRVKMRRNVEAHRTKIQFGTFISQSHAHQMCHQYRIYLVKSNLPFTWIVSLHYRNELNNFKIKSFFFSDCCIHSTGNLTIVKALTYTIRPLESSAILTLNELSHSRDCRLFWQQMTLFGIVCVGKNELNTA